MSKVPFASWVTVPKPAPVSPQLIVTVKSLGTAPLRVLVNEPIRPEKGAPSIGAMVLAIALMLSRQRSSRLSKERRRRSRRRLALATGRPRRKLRNQLSISRFLGGGQTEDA